ncbi:MAG TPA: VOC family protein [Firmicutes bacterium]|jgi:PhnB protein|nr:MAG: MerR family transcriptional regulator [Peptococcaceae bacterium 1109]HHT73589.1 VOC family protein [Bacillota bacterium]
MVGVEIDMVVKDSLAALALYEKIFEVERIEVTDFPQGQNEAVFSIYGVRFHLLDENPEFQLMAPGEEGIRSVWFNVLVPDIKETFAKAMDAGCLEVQPITEMPEYGVSHASFFDPFGYHWMVHQVHKVVSFEERVKLWEERAEQQG